MKLPRKAFIVHDWKAGASALEVKAISGDVELVSYERSGPRSTAWYRSERNQLTRQQARKFIRRLLAAIDDAEAFDRGARLVRRAF